MNDPSLGTNLIRVNPQIFLFSFFHHCLPRIDGPTEVSSVLRDTFPYLTPFPPERFLISFAATTEFWRLPFILLSISSGIIHNIAPYHYIMGTVGFFFFNRYLSCTNANRCISWWMRFSINTSPVSLDLFYNIIRTHILTRNSQSSFRFEFGIVMSVPQFTVRYKQVSICGL